MNKIDELVNHVKKADAIIVGAGSGMSNAAGMAFILNLIPKKSIGLLCLNL